ncbi:DUF2304 domain-containing protein [Arthrobacter sp. CJ23]|uniref:DUF2304 domain-containing protein n=1 Tax=Arthrobacter sp. CJ23 TaxID=2972479 RepID=UPI00215C6AD2|nr:DUF2304 domain-containing protein [Arthrobacter sp. CJ23]UVJ38309.1 DUF2304 domain-containing protein [Arthrobacter sp. CJ23]
MGNIAAFLLALVIVAMVIEMLRRKKLREKYAALWLVVGIATLVLAAFPRLLNIVAEFVGVQLPSNLLFIMSILMLMGVCLHLSWEISVVEDETRTLAEEVAILRSQIEALPASTLPPRGNTIGTDFRTRPIIGAADASNEGPDN